MNQKIVEALNPIALPLAISNLVLLALHQMDAVFWKEWEIFGSWMSYEVFLLITIVLCFPGIIYIGKLAEGKRSGYVYALIWSFFGFIVLIFHSVFLLIGDFRFRAPLSLLIIYLAGLVSLPLLIISINRLKKT